MTKGQSEFLDQMTRKLLVEWCDKALRASEDTFCGDAASLGPYLAHAVAKKWLSVQQERHDKLHTYRILAAGWETAARFLKR